MKPTANAGKHVSAGKKKATQENKEQDNLVLRAFPLEIGRGGKREKP